MSDPAEEAISRVKSAGKNYYAVLGVPKNADEAAVKKAYRKLALQLHPDKCKHDGAEEAFKAVSAAYNCLSSESSRRTYDMTGGEMPAGGGNGGGNPFEGVDPNEIFEQFFRQNGGFQGFNGMNGGQTFYFSTGGMGPGGVRFSSSGGNPFFNMGNSRDIFRRAGGDEYDNDDDDSGSRSTPQQSAGLEQLLPDYLKVLIPVFHGLSKVIPTQLLVILAIFIGTLLASLLMRFIMARFMYVMAIFSLAPSKLKWKFFFALLVLHVFDFMP
jgi:hypothetical protein